MLLCRYEGNSLNVRAPTEELGEWNIVMEDGESITYGDSHAVLNIVEIVAAPVGEGADSGCELYVLEAYGALSNAMGRKFIIGKSQELALRGLSSQGITKIIDFTLIGAGSIVLNVPDELGNSVRFSGGNIYTIVFGAGAVSPNDLHIDYGLRIVETERTERTERTRRTNNATDALLLRGVTATVRSATLIDAEPAPDVPALPTGWDSTSDRSTVTVRHRGTHNFATSKRPVSSQHHYMEDNVSHAIRLTVILVVFLAFGIFFSLRRRK